MVERELFDKYELEDDGLPFHVVPCGDLKEHVISASCWCSPQPDEDEPNVIVHNAMDGRDDFETGKRKPS